MTFPFEFMVGAGQMIVGWDVGVPLMTVGARYRFFVPWTPFLLFFLFRGLRSAAAVSGSRKRAILRPANSRGKPSASTRIC